MFIFLYIMFLFLHKIYTSPALHLMVRADTPNVTATAATGSTVATTPSPVGGSTTSTTTNTTASSGNVTQLANNTLSTAQPSGNGTVSLPSGNATVSLPSGNATLSLPSGNKTSANGKDSATVASSNGTKTQGGGAPSGGHTGTFSWSSVLGEAEVSKENSEECPHGILQCVCDAMADFVYGSSEEKDDDDDDDDDKLTNGIFGIFG
uniref:Uncharacterized protein n=1 Tax=Cacopsylla melanoneura TaxID=428564 RepID=A0A8D8Q781_9HEMI